MKLILKHKNKTSRRAIYSLMLVLVFSISGYFHKVDTDRLKCGFQMRYCPLYRAIFTNSPRIIFSTIRRNMETFLLSPSISGYFHGIEGEVVALPMKKLLPSISGYFHKYAKNVLEG